MPRAGLLRSTYAPEGKRLPWRITVGPRGLAAGTVELTCRRAGDSEELAPEAAVARVADIYAAVA